MRPEPLRVVVSGMVAGVPGQGGAAWAVLQWVLGLRRLGHDVLLVEPVDALTRERRQTFDDLVRTFALHGRAALVTPQCHTAGPPYHELAAFARSADVALNTGGILRHGELLEPVPSRVYVDLDPAFTQLWHEQGIDVGLAGHTHFVTVGLNAGTPACPVPVAGVDWLTTLPPVVLDQWPVVREGPGEAWTTVANWRGYGSVEHGGVRHGQKCHSWRELMDLPRLTDARLLPAIAIDPGEEKDVGALDEHGWRTCDPAVVAGTPAAYRSFVRRSRGELGIAKEGYVVSRSGWFSDRSACYLASGRPVVAQDTGWTDHLPAGEGLLPFATADDAARAVATVEADYDHHRRAARKLAEAHLDSNQVIGRLLAEVTSNRPGARLSVAELKDRGEAAFRAGEHGTAVSLFSQAAARNPGQPWRWLWLARAELASGDIDKADAALRRSLQPDPSWVPGCLELAEILVRRGESTEARHHLEDVIDRVDDERALVRAGRTALAGGHPDLAVTAVQKAESESEAAQRLRDEALTALGPGTQVLKEKGARAFEERRFDDAEGWFRLAADATPHQPWRWLWLARAQRSQGKEDGSRASAERALDVAPGWPPALDHLADLHAQAGRRDEAVADWMGIVDGDSDDPRQLARAARMLHRFGVHDAALRGADKVLALRPEDPDALTIKATALWRLGHREQAAEVAATLDGPAGVRVACALLVDAGDPMGAWTKLAAVAEDKADAVHAVRVGHGLRRAGWVAEAGEAYRRAATLAPDDPVAAHALAVWNGEEAVLSGRWSPAPCARTPISARTGRVLHVVGQSLPHVQTGYTLRTHHVVKAQRDAGIDAHVSTQVGFPAFLEERSVEDVDGVPYHRLPGIDEVGLDFELDARIDAVTHLARQLRPSALHAASDFRNAIVALEVGRRLDIPVIYEVRGFWEETRLTRQGPGAGERACYRLHRAVESDAMRRADAVVTLSEVMKERIAARGIDATRISVVPNGVDASALAPCPSAGPSRASLGIERGEVVLGYISSFTPYEGIQHLIRAVALLRTRGHQVKCLLVGDGDVRPQLEEEARRHSVTDSVIFTGRVPHDTVRAYYGLVDVFVVPRTDDAVSHLVTPLKPFEAMAAGNAVVVSNVQALTDLVGHGRIGRVFQAEDPVSLADTVEPLLADPGHRRALGEDARRWVAANHTWSRLAERYVDVYDRFGAV